jgi:hypothetical protein
MFGVTTKADKGLNVKGTIYCIRFHVIKMRPKEIFLLPKVI